MAEYLEREELLRQLRLWHMHRNDAMPDHFHYTGIKAWLEAMPAEDVQPIKHGRWEEVHEWMGDVEYSCSVCGCYALWKELTTDQVCTEYCPYCGAKMDGEDNG